jgi:predicted amidophosphoribosyltransferase
MIDAPLRTTARILSLINGSSEHGFCASCERDTQWLERDHYYRCTGCGQDPLLHADGVQAGSGQIYRLSGRSAA